MVFFSVLKSLLYTWAHVFVFVFPSLFLPDGTQTPKKTASKNSEAPETKRQDSDRGDHTPPFRCRAPIFLQSLPKNHLGSQARLRLQIRQVPQPLPHAVTEAGCQAAGPQVREAGKVALVTPRGPGEVGGVRAPEGVCTWTAATLRAVNANRWVPGGKLASLLRR